MERPKHHRAKNYLQVFDGLTSFRELEDRISGLPTKQERGDAFEVFAEAYFATQRLVQAKTVWPFHAIPLETKERLSIGTGREMGVDGVFETNLGQFNGYQAKFRSGRVSLDWTELSTFMGLTDQVHERVLITNCNDLSQVMNERSGFYCIRGTDLDRLEPRDFEVIAAWLQGAAVEEKSKQPLPHQQIALSRILPTLKEHDRATVIMPCGSGKTLLTLWAAEQMSCRKVLVLVPSLALLRQTLHEWLKETQWNNLIYLCVCSDPTVINKKDEIVIRQSDVDFPVTTNSDTVKRFLEAETEGVKVVFSTYHSARVVAEGMAASDTFELGIFDEAHKTGGREGVNFSFALDNERLAIANRLFLTATPRHYDVNRRDKDGNAKLVYSMDGPEVYGPTAYRLSFSEAVKQNIICGLKVLVSVVTSKMVNDEVLRRAEVEVGNDPVRARQVANQIALKSAIDKSGINRIITFHKTVASAASFTGKGGEGVHNHIRELNAFHVNGTLPTARRESIMSSFQEAKRAVISNARCLVEGVDLPAVDMVAFMSPKRSMIDIVQATGRAMRKSDATNKTTGYILVPLFVEETAGETVEEAVTRSEFDEVWRVLQALTEQDQVLAEIIRRLREDRGYTKGFDDRDFIEKVEVLGPELSLETLRKGITTRIIDRIGSSWDERFGQLKAYKDRYGHCNVPAKWSENPQLGSWVSIQRAIFSRKQLSDDRVRRLNEIGFVWNKSVAVWEERFAELVAFKNTHGHCNVPFSWSENPQFGKWVSRQREIFTREKLSDDRVRRLNEIGFEWTRTKLRTSKSSSREGRSPLPTND